MPLTMKRECSFAKVNVTIFCAFSGGTTASPPFTGLAHPTVQCSVQVFNSASTSGGDK